MPVTKPNRRILKADQAAIKRAKKSSGTKETEAMSSLRFIPLFYRAKALVATRKSKGLFHFYCLVLTFEVSRATFSFASYIYMRKMNRTTAVRHRRREESPNTRPNAWHRECPMTKLSAQG